MRKLSSITLSSVILILLASCSVSNRKEEGDFVDFSSIKEKEIEGTPVFEDLILGDAISSFSFMDDAVLFSYMNESDEGPLLLYDAKTGEHRWIGKWGAGPGEMICQEFAGKTADNDTIFSYDVTLRKVFSFVRRKDTPSAYVYHETIPDSDRTFLSQLKRMDNGFYIGTLYSGRQNLFALYDSKMHEICRFGGLPIKGLQDEEMDLNVFSGEIATHGNSIYFACQKFGYVTRIDISDSGEPTQIWERYFSEPQYEVIQGSIKIKGHDNLRGFYGLAVNGDYLFATYSGVYQLAYREIDLYANVPEYLVVMDVRNGELLHKCHFQPKGGTIALSSDNKKLYMKAYTPEVGIISYDMKDILGNNDGRD